ncbi:MAG: hypothetical protein RL404_1951 [Pseudomonadota bacterium]|jgi:shikimate dehydrogenase
MRHHVTGLIGRGIGESRSPRIHESEAAAHDVPLAYRLVDFTALGRPDDDLADMVHLLAGIGFSGCNITFPFKQAVLPLCDDLSEAANALGAVNTLTFQNGTIRGENTDWVGFAWLIEREVGSVDGATIAQVGAGGAGSATAYALARLGARNVVLFDPQPGRAAELAARLATHFPACAFTPAETAEAAITEADGVVNATPVGMSSVPGVPFDPALMSPSQWLADIIYFPLETQLLAAARRNGQRVANGVSMVIGQAAEALRLITGITPDRERMLARLEAEIAAERAGAKAA